MVELFEVTAKALAVVLVDCLLYAHRFNGVRTAWGRFFGLFYLARSMIHDPGIASVVYKEM